MRISDWSSDVCSSDLQATNATSRTPPSARLTRRSPRSIGYSISANTSAAGSSKRTNDVGTGTSRTTAMPPSTTGRLNTLEPIRSEEHTSELQSLMRISYAVFCLKKKKKLKSQHKNTSPYKH